MINATIYDKAVLIASKFKGRKLNVTPSSPLAMLIARSEPSMLFPQLYGKAEITGKDVEEATSRPSILGVRGHNTTMDEVSAVIASGIDAQISFIRTTVRGVFEKLNKEADALSYTNDVLKKANYSIVEVSFPAIYQEESIINDANTSTVTELIDSVNFSLDLSEYTSSMEFSDILDKFYFTGSEEIDSDLRVRLNNYGGPEVARHFWESIYCQKSQVSKIKTLKGLNGLNEFELIFTYLTAKNLYALDVIPGVKAGQYAIDANFKELLDALRIAIKYEINIYTSQFNAGLIILNVDNDTKIITVNRPVYEKWLASGGNPCALYGHAVSNSSLYPTIASISENTPELVTKWQTYQALKNAEAAATKYIYIRNALLSMVLSVLEVSATEILQPRFDMLGLDVKEEDYKAHVEYAKLVDAIKLYLDGINTNASINITEVLEHIVNNILFDFTSANYYTERMRYYVTEQPDLTSEQMLLLINKDYVGLFIASLISL